MSEPAMELSREQPALAAGEVTLAKRPGSRLPAAMVERGMPVLIGLVKSGHGTPEALIEASREPGTPFHSVFRWGDPDQKLAQEWRVQQARMIWSSVEIRYEDRRGDKQTTRAFVSVAVAKDERQYVSLPTAATNYRDQVLASARSELRAFRRKHSVLLQLLSRDEILSLFENEFFG